MVNVRIRCFSFSSYIQITWTSLSFSLWEPLNVNLTKVKLPKVKGFIVLTKLDLIQELFDQRRQQIWPNIQRHISVSTEQVLRLNGLIENTSASQRLFWAALKTENLPETPQGHSEGPDRSIDVKHCQDWLAFMSVFAILTLCQSNKKNTQENWTCRNHVETICMNCSFTCHKVNTPNTHIHGDQESHPHWTNTHTPSVSAFTVSRSARVSMVTGGFVFPRISYGGVTHLASTTQKHTQAERSQHQFSDVADEGLNDWNTQWSSRHVSDAVQSLQLQEYSVHTEEQLILTIRGAGSRSCSSFHR